MPPWGPREPSFQVAIGLATCQDVPWAPFRLPRLSPFHGFLGCYPRVLLQVVAGVADVRVDRLGVADAEVGAVGHGFPRESPSGLPLGRSRRLAAQLAADGAPPHAVA